MSSCFHIKLKLILKHLKEDVLLGQITTSESAIEFQKRSLVLVHIIFFFDRVAKFSLQDPTNIEKNISAEISPATSCHLRELVLKHMINDLCNANMTSRCKRQGRCSIGL